MMGRREALKDRYEVRPGRHQPRTLRAGAIGLAAIVLAAVFGGYASVTGYMPFLPRGGNLVRADLASAFNLNTSTPVRIKGIGVGEVDKIELRDGGRGARVTMRVDDRAMKLLRADARAAVWARLVLGGNDYIELSPGSAAGKLGDATIPTSRTSNQVDVDQVVDAFTPSARTGLQQTIGGLKTAFSDTEAVHGAVDALAPGLTPLAPTLRALRGQQEGDVGQVVRGFDKLASALVRDEGQLGGIIDAADTTLAVTAARRADLGRALDVAPAMLNTTRTELNGVDRTLDLLDPLADDLRPGARKVGPALIKLQPALGQTRKLLTKTRPLVADLNPAVTSLRRASQQATPLMNDLQPTVTRTKDSLLPFLHAEDDSTHLKNYQLPGPVVAAVDSLSGLFDAGGHVAHFNGSFGARAFHDYLPCSAYVSDPDPSRRLTCEGVTDFVYSLIGGKAPSTTTVRRLAKLAQGAK